MWTVDNQSINQSKPVTPRRVWSARTYASVDNASAIQFSSEVFLIQERVKCLASEQLRNAHELHPTSHGVYTQCYTAVPVYVPANSPTIVYIQCMYGSRTILTQPEFTFWGIVKLSWCWWRRRPRYNEEFHFSFYCCSLCAAKLLASSLSFDLRICYSHNKRQE